MEEKEKKDRKTRDQAIVRELLESLPLVEQQALARFYAGYQAPREIEAELGLPRGRFAEIRMELRKRFFSRLFYAGS
jgi:hypothetical protein